jgi:RIO kinase 1
VFGGDALPFRVNGSLLPFFGARRRFDPSVRRRRFDFSMSFMNHDNDDDGLDPRPYGRRRIQRRVGRDRRPIALTEAALPFASVQVTKTERAWIREHLGPLRDACLIDDVARRIKAGKEATVYACNAHPSTGLSVVAAKLYRAHSLRGAKNTSCYQLGRKILGAEGQAVRPRAWRLLKAISQSSEKGLAATQTSWLMHEFTLLSELHARGADVPRPIAHNDYALLMEFVGDGVEAAPTLNEVTLDTGEAKRCFEQLVYDIELLLELGWVHGDLSAHNILHQPGRIVLIDFPQVVSCLGNPDARAIFERDIERVASYFVRAGVPIDVHALAHELWSKHVPPSEPEP